MTQQTKEIEQLQEQLDNALYAEGIMPNTPLYQWSKVIQKHVITLSSQLSEESINRASQIKEINQATNEFTTQITVGRNEIEQLRNICSESMNNQLKINQAKTDLIVSDIITRISDSIERKSGEIIKEKLPIFENRFYKTAKIIAISKIFIILAAVLLLGFSAGYMYDKQSHDLRDYCYSHIKIDRATGIKWCKIGDI